jgi:hypothetical protein
MNTPVNTSRIRLAPAAPGWRKSCFQAHKVVMAVSSTNTNNIRLMPLLLLLLLLLPIPIPIPILHLLIVYVCLCSYCFLAPKMSSVESNP